MGANGAWAGGGVTQGNREEADAVGGSYVFYLFIYIYLQTTKVLPPSRECTEYFLSLL